MENTTAEATSSFNTEKIELSDEDKSEVQKQIIKVHSEEDKEEELDSDEEEEKAKKTMANVF